MEKKVDYKVYVATVIAHTFWGFSFLASRVALGAANMFVLLSHRFLIAFLAMSVMVLLRYAKVELKGKRVHLLLALSIMQPVIYFLGEQYGIQHSSTIFSGVMIALIPIVSTLVAWPILKERPTGTQILFSILSVSGVIGIGLLSKNSGVLEFGGVIALVVAVCSATGYLLISRSASTEFSAFERTYGMMAVGAFVFTICAAVSVKDDFGAYLAPLADGKYLLSILFLSILCSVVSFVLNSYAIAHLTIARQTAFANLTTAVSVFAGAVFLREPFSLAGVLFCIMILVGIYGVQRSAKE